MLDGVGGCLFQDRDWDQRRLGLLLAATLMFSVVAACDQAEILAGDDGGLDGKTGSGDGVMYVDLLGPPKPCIPKCVSPKFCSYAGVCIKPGTCAHNQDCPGKLVCDPVTKTCVVPGQCGAVEIDAEAIPPNMLIVLDRSCSMTSKVQGKSKWQIAVDALDKLLTTNKGKIRFGLALFPDTTGSSCKQDAVSIAVGPNKEAAIQTLLKNALTKSDKNYPDGPCVTNIDTAMQQAAAHTPLADTTRENFVLLITDGAQAGCSAGGGDKGTTQTITDLWQKKKVATFVVGFGGAVDAKQLNIFANAGGKPISNPTTQYYKAEDQTSLDKALASIAQTSMGCVLSLKNVPADLSKIYVFFDDKEVPRDPTHKNGWDYDAKTNKLTFYGQACKDLQDQKVKDVDIVYGCKKPVG